MEIRDALFMDGQSEQETNVRHHAYFFELNPVAELTDAAAHLAAMQTADRRRTSARHCTGLTDNST
jgi:hypothetical protein